MQIPAEHSRTLNRCKPAAVCLLVLGSLLLLTGCGTTKQTHATDQMLESAAIDVAIAQIDFSPLAGQKVYFDSKYISDYKGVGFVNSNYIISSLRQQMIAAGLLLYDKPDEADYVIEGRIGALGSDAHDVVYGLPQSNALSSVSTIIPGAPALPALPELSVARKSSKQGAAKLALFAYDREERTRVWQSGTSVARSTAKDSWLAGAGPFQEGTIYDEGVRFAGARMPWRRKRVVPRPQYHDYGKLALFTDPRIPDLELAPHSLADGPVDVTKDSKIQQVSGEQPAAESESDKAEGDSQTQEAKKPAPPAASPTSHVPPAPAP